MKIEKHCDGNVIIVEDFLSQEEITQLDSFMRNFDYNNLQEHEFKYWGKRLINDYQMKLNPGYENVMDGVLPTLNSIIQRTTNFLNEQDYQAEWIPSPHNLIKMFSGGNRSITPVYVVKDESLKLRPYNQALTAYTEKVCTDIGQSG